MMKFRYDNISAGYLGIKTENATFNSDFFAELWSKNTSLLDVIQYPQRVPKVGFFDELCSLEINAFSKKFSDFTQKIKDDLSQLFNLQKKNIEQQRVILNYHYLLLRYGQCLYLNGTDFTHCFSDENVFEYKLIQEMVNIEISLSFKKPLLLNSLEELTYKTMSCKSISPILKMKILNRLVVNVARYNNNLDGLKINIHKIANEILSILNTTKVINFNDRIAVSIIYRGIAMVKEYGEAMQNELLSKSLEYANQVKPRNTFEAILLKDNIYTLLQTMSKWYTHNNKLDLAEECLNTMVHKEPNDSTAFCELGIFLFKRERFSEAADTFVTAYRLGPPSVGMNMYFYAKCLEKLNNKFGYIQTLKEVVEVDHFALSPWLDIMDYESEQGNIQEVKRITRHILGTSVIADQLTESEIIKLQKSVNL